MPKFLSEQAIETLEARHLAKLGNYHWGEFLTFISKLQVANAVQSTIYAASIDSFTEVNLRQFAATRDSRGHLEHLNKILTYLEHVKAKVFHSNQHHLFANFALMRFWIIHKFVCHVGLPQVSIRTIEIACDDWSKAIANIQPILERIDKTRRKSVSEVLHGQKH